MTQSKRGKGGNPIKNWWQSENPLTSNVNGLISSSGLILKSQLKVSYETQLYKSWYLRNKLFIDNAVPDEDQKQKDRVWHGAEKV